MMTSLACKGSKADSLNLLTPKVGMLQLQRPRNIKADKGLASIPKLRNLYPLPLKRCVQTWQNYKEFSIIATLYKFILSEFLLD